MARDQLELLIVDYSTPPTPELQPSSDRTVRHQLGQHKETASPLHVVRVAIAKGESDSGFNCLSCEKRAPSSIADRRRSQQQHRSSGLRQLRGVHATSPDENREAISFSVAGGSSAVVKPLMGLWPAWDKPSSKFEASAEWSVATCCFRRR